MKGAMAEGECTHADTDSSDDGCFGDVSVCGAKMLCAVVATMFDG